MATALPASPSVAKTFSGRLPFQSKVVLRKVSRMSPLGL